MERLVREELPPELQQTPYVAVRTAFLLASPGIAVAVRSLPGRTPVADRSALGGVTAQVLLLAQEEDPLHPAQVARDLAAVLPNAQLVVFDRPGVLFRERARLRALLRRASPEDDGGAWLSAGRRAGWAASCGTRSSCGCGRRRRGF